MAIPKVIGTETEYGIAAVGQPDFNPVLSSSMLISSYAGSLRRIRWDYEDESPLRDARGFEPAAGRELSDEDLGLANVILPNGARYYVDHAHPEYSTPECLSPRALVIHDKAGERILERSLAVVAAEMPSSPTLAIYKNNSDGKGNSYGTHEPIINTRDEPHADPERYRRLHVIVGDANLCEVALFLKMGTTAIVLKMIEDAFLPDFSLVNPVAAIHDVSRDVSLTTQVSLTDGRKMTALQLQWEYLELARKYVDREDDTAENREVLERWESVLRGLETDPRTLSAQLDWVAKLRLLEGYRDRDGLAWSDAKLRAIDLQYHDVRRDRGLYHRLAHSGKVERLTTDEEVQRAIMEPPEDTRAFFRGRCISKFPDAIAAASWDSLILDTGRDALQRIPMREPLRGTRAHVEELLDACEDAAALVDRLTG